MSLFKTTKEGHSKVHFSEYLSNDDKSADDVKPAEESPTATPETK